MLNYTVPQWLFLFYLYCFFGWCFESTYVSIKEKKLVNRGFLNGPFLPIYGSGAIMMLVVSKPVQDNLVLIYISGVIGATVLELVTGIVMESIFKVRYWDYSHKKVNYKGYICLESSIAWGFLTIFMTQFLHGHVEKLAFLIPDIYITYIAYIATLILAGDFVLSFKTAIDFKNILIKLEEAKLELENVHKRLEVILEATENDFLTKTENFVEKIENKTESFIEKVEIKKDHFTEDLELKMEDLKNGIEERLENIKEISSKAPTTYLENVREEIAELKIKYSNNLKQREKLFQIKDFHLKKLIHSNPTLTSRKFKEGLEEFIQKLNDKKEN